MNKDYLILASKSPRREYLLTQAGLKFTISVSSVDEEAMPWSDPETYTRQLAQAKAEDVATSFPDSWVLGADTIVVLDDMVLEKPDSVEQARQMLTLLSGVTHRVYTGFAIVCLNRNGIIPTPVSLSGQATGPLMCAFPVRSDFRPRQRLCP